jgi:chain length determinant protein EpsF
MTPRQFLLIIRARYRLAVAIFVAVVVTTLLASLSLPARYTAEATVVADSNRLDPLAQPGAPPVDAVGFLATQVSIITSERVVNRAAESYQFDPVSDKRLHAQWMAATQGHQAFAEWLSGRLTKKLKVAAEGTGNVVDISVTWSDPINAAGLANAIANTYLDTSISLRIAPAEKFSGAFDERAQELRADLQTRQQRLNDFMASNNMVPSDDRMDIELSRLSELSTQLVSVQSQRQESESRQRELGSRPRNSPDILQNTLITELKAELARDEAKQRDIETNLGPNHPDSQRNVAEIHSLQQRIAEESVNVSASLSSVNNVNVRRESELSAAIDAQKQRILQLRTLRDQAALLQNDVATTRHSLDEVTQHLAQSDLIGAARQSSAVLLSAASPPDRRSAPDVTTNTILGIFFGLLLGAGVPLLMETVDRRVRSEIELERLLNVPLLGKISSMPKLPTSHVRGLLRSGS